jgi:hypothetical protein
MRAKREAVIDRLKSVHADRAAPTRTYFSGRILVIGLSFDDLQQRAEPLIDEMGKLLNQKGNTSAVIEAACCACDACKRAHRES